MANDDIVRIQLAVDEATVSRVQNRIRSVINGLNNQALNIRVDTTGLNNLDRQLTRIQQRIRQIQSTQVSVPLTTAQQSYRLENQRLSLQNQQLAIQQRLQLARERTLQAEAMQNRTLTRNLNVTQQVNGQVQHTHDHIRHAANEANNLATYLQRGLQAFIGYRIINAVASSISEAYGELKNVDTEMVSIRKVTGMSADEMERLADASYKVAENYGRSASQYLSSVADFAKAGYDEQAEELGELSMLAMNTGDINEDLASQFLISADAAWKYGGNIESLRAILDNFNELSNKSATTVEDLADGITVAGSVFAQAGLSAQDYASIVGTVQASTQLSGKTVGRSLRNVLLTLRQIKGTDLETGEIIDEEKLAKGEKVLNAVGISIRETVDGVSQLRNPMIILQELADKWESLSSIQQSAIQEGLAGKYNSNVFTSLMENFEQVEKAAKICAESSGSALRENEYYLDSWSAKTEILKANWTSYIAGLQDTESIKDFLDLLTDIVNVLDTDLGRFITQIVLLSTTLNLLNRGFTWIQSLQAFQRLNLSAEILRITAAEYGLGSAARVLTATLWEQASAWLATPIGQITAVIASATIIVNAYDNALSKAYDTAQEGIRQADEQIEKYDAEISSLEELQGKLIDAKGNKEALAQIQADLNKEIGETPGLLNGESSAYDTANNKIQARIDLIKELRKEEENRKLNNSKEAFNSNFVEVPYGINAKGDDIRKQVQQYYEDGAKNARVDKNGKEIVVGTTGTFDSPLDYINSKQSLIHQITPEEWESYWNEQIQIAQDVFEDTINNYNGVGGAEILNLIVEDAVKAGNDLSQVKAIIKGFTSDTDLQDSVNAYWDSLGNSSNSEIALGNVSKKLDELKAKYPELTDVVDTFYNTLLKGNEIDVAVVPTVAEREGNPLTPQIKNLQTLSEGFEALDKLYADIKDGGTFDFTNLVDDKFVETFSGFEDEYNNLIETISASPDNIGKCQSAFNELVKTWIKSSDVVNDLDEENKQLTIDMLKNYGVTNASEVVNTILANKQNKLATEVQFTADEIKSLTDKYGDIQPVIDDTTGLYTIQQTALEKLGISAYDAKVQVLQAERDKAQAVVDSTRIIIQNIQKQASAWDVAYTGRKFGNIFGMSTAAKEKEMADAQAEVDNIQKQLDDLANSVTTDVVFDWTSDYEGGNKSNKSSSKSPKSYDDHREYFDYYDEELSTKEKFIDNFIDENDRLDRKFEKALEDSDFATGEILRDKLNENSRNILEELAKNANDARYVLNEDIMPKLRDIASQYGFDWSGLSIAEISDTEIEKVRQALQDDINRQKDIGVDMQNAETGDNAFAIKDAEIALQRFEDLNKSAESYYDKVGTKSGEGEWGAKYLEEEAKILENNLKYQEAKSEALQDQSDDIEHQIELQRNAFNGDDVSNDHIENEIALRKQQQEIAHQDAEMWREYYRALGYTEDAIEKTAEVQEAQKRWWDAEKKILESYQETIDKATKGMDERIKTLEYEYEQENLIIDALEKKNELQRKLREEQRDLRAEYEATQDIIAITGDDGTLFNKEDYDELAREIKSIDSDITSLYEDYKDAINALGEDEWYKQQEITNEFERQQEALLDQYEIAKKQLEVTRQRTKLENILNNKNKRVLIGGKWVNTPDLKAVYEERKNLIALEDEEYELRKESAENKHISALRKLNDSTNTEAKAIQHRIDMIEEMTAEERKALAQELLKVEDMDDILNGLKDGALPKLVAVINGVIDSLGELGDVEFSSGGSNYETNRENFKDNGHGELVSNDQNEGFKMDSAFAENVATKSVSLMSADDVGTGSASMELLSSGNAVSLLSDDVPVVEKPKIPDNLIPVPVDELLDKLRGKSGLLSENMPSLLSLPINPAVLQPNITLPKIPEFVKNTNTNNSQVINIQNIDIKEPVQNIGDFMDSVFKEANLYHLRTKNMR